MVDMKNTLGGQFGGSTPLTASNTDADTREMTREVTSGLVPLEIALSFVNAIQSRTGSDAKADTAAICVKRSVANSSQERMRDR